LLILLGFIIFSWKKISEKEKILTHFNMRRSQCSRTNSLWICHRYDISTIFCCFQCRRYCCHFWSCPAFFKQFLIKKKEHLNLCK
jgi:hypothetical protein